MFFDVIIVGGSFSGLSCAYHLAKQGIKVCLFEKNKIGTTTKSTGILTQSAIKDSKIPKELIENEVKGAYLFSPSMRKLKIKFNFPIYQSRTLEFLKWLKELAISYDVKIFEKKFCSHITISQKNVFCEGQTGKMIIFATGTFLPNVKNVCRPKQKLYVGMEYIATGNFPLENTHFWHVFGNTEISPGYVSWLAPIDDRKCHVGILKRVNDKKPAKACLLAFLKKIKGKIKKIHEKRAGTVPLSGPIEKTYGHRHIFVGDAAGQVGALASDGIDYCVRVGKIVGRVLPGLIDYPTENNLKNYEVEWKKEFGKQLQEQLFLRNLYDKVDDNRKLEKMFDLISSIPSSDLNDFLQRWSKMEEMKVYRYLIMKWPKLIRALL